MSPSANFSLDTFLDSRRQAGRAQLTSAVRHLCVEEWRELEPIVASLDDDVVRDPRLLGHFSIASTETPLAQLLYGLISPEKRPDAVEIRTCRRGVACVPNVGYFLTNRVNKDLILHWNKTANCYTITDAQEEVYYDFRPILRVKGTNIEVANAFDVLIDGCLQHAIVSMAGENSGETVIVTDGGRHLPAIEKALSMIEKAYPEHHAALLQSLKYIVLFHHPFKNSFAALATHGAIYLNLRWPATPAFFFDEIAHQGGHVIFNEATMNEHEILKLPKLDLADLIGRPDHRCLYEALHGLYTEYVMCKTMNAALSQNLFSEDESEEVWGRLCFATQKAELDLRNMGTDTDRVFTEIGKLMYEFFGSAHRANVALDPVPLTTDMSGTEYEFNYRLFAKKNGPRSTWKNRWARRNALPTLRSSAAE